jgi:hypothetical protein
MNTARQLLWLPTSREEKYKAKQAIDTFFVRGGDVLSAGAVYVGTRVVQMSVAQFALVNLALTVLWIGVALLILKPRLQMPSLGLRPAMTAAVGLMVVALAAPPPRQDTREEQLAAQRAEKATQLRPYEPEPLERRIEKLESALLSRRPVYTFIGSAFPGGGLAVGPATVHGTPTRVRSTRTQPGRSGTTRQWMPRRRCRRLRRAVSRRRFAGTGSTRRPSRSTAWATTSRAKAGPSMRIAPQRLAPRRGCRRQHISR